MLKRIFWIFLLFSIFLHQFAFSANNLSLQPQVIIIGAGVAGLEAGNYLLSHGVSNFIILEARDRIGGRVHTVKLGNANVDIGATWIHGGSSDNPLMKIVKSNSFHTYPTNEKSLVIYNYLGEKIDDANYDSLYEKFTSFLENKRKTSNIENASISNIAVDFIKKNNLDREMQNGLIFEVAAIIEQNYAANITELSARWYDNDEEFSGVDRIPANGYQEIIDSIAKNLQSHLLLSHVVTKINYSNPNDIQVTTSNNKIFHAQYVICTLPIGVLKHGDVKFIPELPRNKIEALSHMNMGTMDKVILFFPYVFWDNLETIAYMADAYWSGEKWVNKGEWIEFDNMNAFTKKNILSALISADFADEIENQSDEKIIQKVMRVLRTIYKKEIPKPTSYIITRWGKDIYSHGSFSSLRPGALADSEDYTNMAKTINHTLLFAGEGTSDLYPATVYGAYLSGDRAAREVLTNVMPAEVLTNVMPAKAGIQIKNFLAKRAFI